MEKEIVRGIFIEIKDETPLYYEVLDRIDCWCKSSNWQIEDFSRFIESVNIPLPILLTQINNNKFHCSSTIEADIELEDGEFFDSPTIIKVEKGNIKQTYYTTIRSRYRDPKFSVPRTVLDKQTVEKSGRIVNSSFLWHTLNCKVEEATTILTLEINRQHGEDAREKFDLLESYLLQVNLNKKLETIYNQISKVFSTFSECTISRYKKGILTKSFCKTIN